jgi:hypothetical protein
MRGKMSDILATRAERKEIEAEMEEKNPAQREFSLFRVPEGYYSDEDRRIDELQAMAEIAEERADEFDGAGWTSPIKPGDIVDVSSREVKEKPQQKDVIELLRQESGGFLDVEPKINMPNMRIHVPRPGIKRIVSKPQASWNTYWDSETEVPASKFKKPGYMTQKDYGWLVGGKAPSPMTKIDFDWILGGKKVGTVSRKRGGTSGAAPVIMNPGHR